MKDEGKDIYDIKKAEEVLQESYMMIPDSRNRFQKSLDVRQHLPPTHPTPCAPLHAPPSNTLTLTLNPRT